jgi:hypothetical protein
MGLLFNQSHATSDHTIPGHHCGFEGPQPALLWLGHVRREFEAHAFAADQEELPGLRRCISHLGRLADEHGLLDPQDCIFLRDVALQLALWDVDSDGRVTWRSLAADDLADLARASH